MPGTLLLDDWQNAVQDRLNEHIKNLQASTQSALEQVAQPVQQIQQALPQIDPNAIGARLNGLVDSLTQANAQPVVQTFQPIGQNIQDQVGQTLAPVGEAKDAIAQRLQAHVDSLTSAPQMPQVQSLGAQPAAGADVLGSPPSADTLGAPLHEPSPPQQTPGTQVANTPDASGRIFPLAARPSNTPTATYHSQGGSDLMAPRGTPVLNMQNGRVDEVFTDNGSHTVGGNAVLVHGDDGLDYYYAHFDQPPSVKPGQRIAVGEQIGAVGNSGNAYKGGAGETHLHIGIGHGISNGVGSEGGLGQDFNAQKLLTDLQSGIGQASATVKGAAQQVGATVLDKVGQGQQDFVNSLQPLAQEVASRTGIDPNAMLAIAANETGWGRSQTAQQQNNLFSIQGDGSNGSRWATYSSPTQAFDAFVNLIKTAPRYAQAWADRADPGKFVDDLRHAGYVVDEPGFPAQGWVDQVKSIYGRLPPSSDQSGPSPQRAAAAGPVALGEAPSANPVLYAKTSQPTALGEAGQRPANEVIPQAVQAIGEGVGQAASNLGSAAQGALGAISEANRVQPGTAALQAVQQATAPGGPVGQVASDLGSAVSSAYGLNRSLDDQQRRNEQYQQDVQAAAEAMNRRSQEPQTLGGVASGVWGLITGANPPMGISLQQYQDQQQVKNQWIEQNNPAKQLTEAGVPLVEGLTTGIAQQLTDPLMLTTFGPTMGAGRAIGAGAARGVEAGLAERLSPQAVQFAATVADKLTSGAFIGGVQNALMAAEKPDATPESVFDALWKGAAFGGAVDVGAAAVTPIARRIGQQLIDQAPELRAALRSRQPAQAEINAALGGAPEAVARVGNRLRPAVPEGLPLASVPSPERVQAFQPELRPVAAGEVPLYHGGIAGDLATDRPTFLTSDRDAAEFYATERGGTGGRVREATVRPTNPATFDELQATVRAVGATPDDIRANSPYEGENPLDYVYVPAVRRALEARGFDGVVSVDAIGNREVPVAVTWRPGAPEAAPEPAAVPTTRMYHGTAGEFDRPTADKFDQNGLFGPGYYLTDRPEVAGGVVRNADVVPQPGDVESVWGNVLGPENPANRRGAVVEPGYAQQRMLTDAGRAQLERQVRFDTEGLARARANPVGAGTQERIAHLEDNIAYNQARLDRGTAGANVRAVDVPQNLKLLNADAPPPADVKGILQADYDRMYPNHQSGTGPANLVHDDTLAELLTYAERGGFGSKQSFNKALAQAGYDGITYAGGQRIPMTDAAGAPIEHQASVIFPESMPKIRNAISGRQGGQASLPFATNLAGAAVGGYAGNAATPEDAPLDVRLRNIGLGASAGLLGTHALTRGGGRLAEAVAARVEGRAPESRGFTAPARPTLEDQLLQARTRAPEGGAPPPAAREPRTLSEVQSNPHLLREAAPGETPMTSDELAQHTDTLSERYQANVERLAAIDDQLRNPTAKPARPPWAGGFTNDQVAEMAAKVGRSAYEPLWWEKAGLETGSGEVRALLNEYGIQRGAEGAAREPSPADLRREAATLTQDQQHLVAAGEHIATLPDDARVVRPPERTPAGELPFSEGGAREPGAQLAQEVVTKKGGIASDENQVVAVDSASGIGGRGIVNPAEVVTEAPSKETAARMPNLNAIGKDMPETIAQIQKSAEDNPELWDHYQQGRISFDSLKNDLAARVGMSKEDWLKTKVGQALNPQEMVALQAAMVEEQARQTDLARTILAKGGVDKLTPEELAYSITQLTQAQALSAVAKGAGSTVARSLNARKISFTRQLASDITSANERKAAQRVKAQAARVATRAGDLLDKAAATDKEKVAAVARARTEGAPKNIVDQIAAAYDELDRYNAMSLHEKATVFDKLKADRDAAAAARKAAVRGAPEELLSALKAELKAEQDNFAKRKSTWETMAFQDEKAFGNMMDKRTAFRGGLYIETQRKSAQLALQNADKEMNRAFDAEMQRRGKQSDKAQKLLESMGGVQVTKDLLNNYIAALNDPDPRVAAKFLQATAKTSNWARATTLRIAGLLSSPITQMVNIGGNVSGAVVEVPTRALVVGIDALRAAATGGERQAYAGELIPMLKAYGPGMLGALPEAVRTFKTGITAEQLADPTRIRGRFSPSEKVNMTVEAPLRALQAEDVIFRQAAYSAHGMRVASRQAIREGFKGKMVEERAATILKNLEDYPELAKEAQDAAARQVYQERRTIPGMGTSVPTEQGDISRFASSQVMPFVRTPMNITAQGVGMSPLGVTGVLQAAGKARNMPVGTAAERAARGREVLLAEERGARAVIGSAILGGGLALGGAGMLTAAYPADPTEASTLPQGWRPWSLRLTSPVDNNTYYIPLQNMGPPGMALAMASILTDPKHRDAEGSILDPQEQQRAVMGLGRYVIDNTFLQGISDMVDALHDPKTGASKFLEPWAASYGPYSSLARESQRMMGVASRNPHDGLMGLVEAFEANYPGLSGNVPEALTPLGEPRTQGATGLARLVPVRYDIERDDPTLAVLRENKVGIPPEPKQMNIGRGQSLDLTEDEQAQVKRDRGAAIKQAVDEVQKTRAWQSSDLSARNALLKQAVNYATQNANIRFYQSLTAAEVQSRAKDRAVPEPYYLGAAP